MLKKMVAIATPKRIALALLSLALLAMLFYPPTLGSFRQATQVASNTLTLGLGSSVDAAGVADATCDGAADDIQAQALVTALPAAGGRLYILTGTYVWANGTTVTDASPGITISGTGVGTYITGDGATSPFTAGGNNWVLENLRVSVTTAVLEAAMGATTGWEWRNVTTSDNYHILYSTGASNTTYLRGDSTWQTPAGGSGTYAPVLVAADNATAAEKLAAVASDGIVCDGTSDETDINTAITASGNVILSSGTFTIDGDILMLDNSRLLGQGINKTIINAAPATHVSAGISISNVSNVEVGGFKMIGNTSYAADDPVTWWGHTVKISQTTGNVSKFYIHDIWSTCISQKSVFYVYAGGAFTIDDILFERCTADSPDGFGFLNNNDVSAVSKISNLTYRDCKAIDCGVAVTRYYVGAGTIANGTGTLTAASPLTLKAGFNTVGITTAGTFTVTLTGVNGKATSDGWVVDGSPQALVAGANAVTVNAGGAGSIIVRVGECFVTGFDFCDSDDAMTMENVTAINCVSDGAWESGFHCEYVPVFVNCSLINCRSTGAGVNTDATGTCIYGHGFLISGQWTVTDCYGWENGNGTQGAGIILSQANGSQVIGGQFYSNYGAGVEIADSDYTRIVGINSYANGGSGIHVSNTGGALGTDDNTVSNCTIYGNTGYQLYHGAVPLRTLFLGNNVTAGGFGAYWDGGTGVQWVKNIGIVTANSGSGTLLNGQATIVIHHGLATTPDCIIVTWKEDPTNVIADWWIDTIDTEHFTLNGVDPGGSNLDFFWRASVGAGN